MKENNIMIISAIVNFTLSLIKIASGNIFHLSSLAANGIHSLSDLLTDLIIILSNNILKKFKKLENLIQLLIGVIISIMGIFILFNNSLNIIYEPNVLVILIIIFSIIIKTLLVRFLFLNSKKYNSNLLLISAQESNVDLISEIFILISSILMQLQDKVSYFKYSDKIITIIVGILIIKIGIKIITDNTKAILNK